MGGSVRATTRAAAHQLHVLVGHAAGAPLAKELEHLLVRVPSRRDELEQLRPRGTAPSEFMGAHKRVAMPTREPTLGRARATVCEVVAGRLGGTAHDAIVPVPAKSRRVCLSSRGITMQMQLTHEGHATYHESSSLKAGGASSSNLL